MRFRGFRIPSTAEVAEFNRRAFALREKIAAETQALHEEADSLGLCYAGVSWIPASRIPPHADPYSRTTA